MQYEYFIFEEVMNHPGVCKGAVLNVGLGLGASARAFLASPYIARVSTVEISQPVIDAYRSRHLATELLEAGTPFGQSNRHRIALGNAATVPANQINPPFDFVYIDTISNWDEATFADLRAVVLRLKQPGALTASGVLNIQYWSDVQKERQHRQWMEDQGWVPVQVRPPLAERGRGRAAAMMLYHL